MKRLIALLYGVGIATFFLISVSTHSGVPGTYEYLPSSEYLAIAGLACFPIAVTLTVIHAWRSNPSPLAIVLLIPIGYCLVLIGMMGRGGPNLFAYVGTGILALALLLTMRTVVARALPGAVRDQAAANGGKKWS